MKIWNQYGSEHSMNLVMIGSFKEANQAEVTKLLIEQLADRARDEPSRPYMSDPQQVRFSKPMLDFLMSENLSTIGAAELEQFAYDVHIVVEGGKLILRTDESDVAAFIKLLIEKGARVEVYSAHEYPDSDAKSKRR